ncbi:DoxX family protein [Zhouia spongiae]|uniref:DoxX family protein n=1 Tax=Zhouia spongiae TaxID=2202721 RepID=A0ABY3YL37_9FLAO|nr:DoxX family protein [Zhouia spongiae]UNY98551.1 DoxX family protein [Zhouia spongiae]
MEKRKKVIYWITTGWLALGMTSTGIVQLIKMEEEVSNFTNLGYPLYLLTLLGVWKLLGVIAILTPKLPLLKEWAYAGFFFAMSGAIISHLAVGDEIISILGPAILLALTIASWYVRPVNRKMNIKTLNV